MIRGYFPKLRFPTWIRGTVDFGMWSVWNGKISVIGLKITWEQACSKVSFPKHVNMEAEREGLVFSLDPRFVTPPPYSQPCASPQVPTCFSSLFPDSSPRYYVTGCLSSQKTVNHSTTLHNERPGAEEFSCGFPSSRRQSGHQKALPSSDWSRSTLRTLYQQVWQLPRDEIPLFDYYPPLRAPQLCFMFSIDAYSDNLPELPSLARELPSVRSLQSLKASLTS